MAIGFYCVVDKGKLCNAWDGKGYPDNKAPVDKCPIVQEFSKDKKPCPFMVTPKQAAPLKAK